MAYKTVTQIFNECFDDTNNALKVKITVNDDKLLKIGTDADSVILNRSTSLSANTALANVIVGTPDTQAIVADSLVISNTTQDADIHLIANDGGNSQTMMWVDASASTIYFPHKAVFNGELHGQGVSYFETLQGLTDDVIIQARNNGTSYIQFKGYNGSALVEVARVQGAADPYFSMGGSQELKVYNSGKIEIASGGTLEGAGTGANGFVLKNLKNAAASALSGTQLDVEIDIGGTPYYFTVYPSKA